MGRLIEAHRQSSRSQRDLFLQAAALQHGAVFNHIKMAVGFLPFIGAAVGLYDGWVSANLAVDAFLAGRPVDAMEHVESVLLSLIDAAFDVMPVPSFASFATPGATSRRAVAQATRPRTALLAGYEADVNLVGLQAGHSGRYQGVYRHADGDFIYQAPRTSRVEWDDTRHIWRLAATAERGYRQPVILDDLQQWTTYGALTGYLVPGGAGGGAYLGRLAQEGWLGLAGVLRRRLLGAETEAARSARLQREFSRHLGQQDALLEGVVSAQAAYRATPGAPAAVAALTEQRLKAIAFYEALVDKALEMSRLMRMNAAFKTSLNGAIEELLKHSRALHLLILSELTEAVSEIRHLTARQIPDDPVQMDQLRALTVRQLERVYDISSRLLDHRQSQETWVGRLRQQPMPHAALKSLDQLLEQSPSALDHKTGQMSMLTSLALNQGPLTSVVAQAVRQRFMDIRSAVIRASITYRELGGTGVVISTQERATLLRSVVSQFERFELKAADIQAQLPEGLNPPRWQALLQRVEALKNSAQADLDRIEDSLRRMTQGHAMARPARTTTKRTFETADNEMLVGTVRRNGRGEERIDLHEPVTDNVLHTYRREADGKWVQEQAPASGQPSLDQAGVVRLARAQLAQVPELTRRVEGYASLNREAEVLEELLGDHARQLRQRADDLTAIGSATEPQLVAQLRTQERALINEGARLRAQVTKRGLPTAAALKFLLARGEAFIARTAERLPLRNARGRVTDYLQEYVVTDAATQRPIWYAHFHYDRATSAFETFSRAHLKTPEQHRLGRRQQMLQEQRGETVTPLLREQIYLPFALEHFQNVG